MISVIIPAYNSERYIRPCLDSLLGQTCRDWEAIVVDDGSTDFTAGIVREYVSLDPRFRLVSITNSGQGSARNAGLEVARGEWIAFLDSDDAFPPRALEILLHAAMETDTQLVYGRTMTVDEMPCFTDRDGGWTDVRVRPGKEVLLEVLYQTPGGAIASIWDKLWSRDLIGDDRFIEGKNYEDLDFTCRLLQRVDRLAVTDEVVYYYRRNPQSFLHTFSERRFDSLTVTENMESRSAGDAELLRAARERTMSAAFNILWLLTVNPVRRQAYQAMADRCREVIRERRWSSLTNSRVRPKNRAAALLSYLGRGITDMVLRLGHRVSRLNPPQTD